MQDFQQEINTLLANKKYKLATKKIKQRQKKQPQDPELIRLMAVVYIHQNKLLMAEKILQKAISVKPDYTPALNNMAFVQFNKGDYDRARILLEKSLKIYPTSLEAHHQLGNIYNIQENYKQAEFHFNQAINIEPKHNLSRANLAILLKNRGEIDAAVTHLKLALAINPEQPQLYWILANLKSYTFSQTEKDMVKLLLGKTTSGKDKEALLFTTAKLLEDDKQYEKSFRILKQANAEKHNNLQHKATDWPALLSDIKALFTSDYVRQNQIVQGDNNCATPILIAGMPRSGSTLIEQILASHSQISGASELTYLNDLLTKEPMKYPERFKEYGQKDFQELGQKYLSLTQRWYKRTNNFTDKMPNNINHAGILLMAIPQAKLIHSRRNPMDVCLSVFKQNFEQGNAYSYELAELVQYYKFQEKVAELWENLFPGRVIRVDYEHIIEQTEQQIRKLLDFLSLSFEDECLTYYKTKRIIGTASAGQVTQKIYKKGIGYFKNYGAALQQLDYLLKLPFGTEKLHDI